VRLLAGGDKKSAHAGKGIFDIETFNLPNPASRRLRLRLPYLNCSYGNLEHNRILMCESTRKTHIHKQLKTITYV
jgi:hypothetical protein